MVEISISLKCSSNIFLSRHWWWQQPNGYPSQMCLAVYVYGDYPDQVDGWYAIDCNAWYKYICEVDPEFPV